MTPLVDLRDVFVVHASDDGGVAALRGLTLAVDPGEICVVLGPAAQESTLVRVVAGLSVRPPASPWSTDSTWAPRRPRPSRDTAVASSAMPISTTGARCRTT